MVLTDMDITAFVDALASDSPAPGGGSAAALTGALGTALLRMVAGLTATKKKYAEHEPLMRELMAEADALIRQLTDCVNRDAAAYDGVTAAYTMPKDTPEQKELRGQTVQDALKACTIVPIETMRNAAAALELAERALGKSLTGAASDLGVSALSLKAAVQGAWLNVLINLKYIDDTGFAAQYRSEGEEIIKKSASTADRIYENILKDIRI